jgi:MSHA biogenesis protein MshG
MTNYRYRAKNAQGKVVVGNLDSISETAVVQELNKMNLVPLIIEEASPDMTVTDFVSAALGIGKPTSQDLIVFSRQMHTMAKAGVAVVKSITVVAGSSRSEGLKKALLGVVEHLQAGNSLSSSFQRFPKVFSPIMVSMIGVGESTGALEEAFLQIAHYLETDAETRKQIKSATRYPIIVLSAVFMAIMVINIFVVPSFKGFFSKFGSELPLPTRILMATSEFCLNYWPHVLVGIVGAIVGLSLYVRSENGGIVWDRFVLKVPIIGPILEKALLARFSRAFSMTMKAGVPLLQALSVISNAVGNRYITTCIMMMRANLEHGMPLIQAAKESQMFTPLVLQMLSIGDETGEIDSMLNQVAGYYEDEVAYDLRKLSDSIEPILIIFIAIVVLILALGVFLPMWDLSSVALKKMKH